MRLLIQIPLSLGILILSPLAFPLLVAPIFPEYWKVLVSGDLKATYYAVVFPAGAFGILALWASVVTPERFVWRHGIFRRVVIAGLAMGSVAAVTIVVEVVPKHFSAGDTSRLLGDAWLYGGSLTVAVWNIQRLWGGSNSTLPRE